MGEIRKLKNGRYQADVVNSYGKRLRRNFIKKADAQAFISVIEKSKYDMKLYNLNIIRKRKSILEAIEEAKDSKGSLRKNSIKKYNNVYRQFELFTIQNKIEWVDEFMPEHATKYSESLNSTNAAAKTVNFYLMAAKALFQDLVNMDLIQRNPFSHIKYVKNKIKTLKQQEEDYFTEEEIIALLSINMDTEYKNALTALYLTGMRVEELSSLKWEHVDYENKLIKIRTDGDFKTKTASSERDIPVCEALYRLLKTVPKKCDYIFPSKKGKKLSERTLLQAFKRTAREAKIGKNAKPHMLRHSFNSHLTLHGVSFEIREYFMGHKPQSMTDRYTKFDPTKMHKYLDGLNELMDKMIK